MRRLIVSTLYIVYTVLIINIKCLTYTNYRSIKQ